MPDQKNTNFLIKHLSSVIAGIAIIAVIIGYNISPRIDMTLTVLSIISIIAITFFYDFLFHQGSDKYEYSSNVLKNWIEIALILTGAFLTYQSDWFDKFFNEQTVHLTQDIQFQFDCDRLSLNDSLIFKYTFIGTTEANLPKTYQIVKGNYGIIDTKLQLNKGYHTADIECLNQNYIFHEKKSENTNIQDLYILRNIHIKNRKMKKPLVMDRMKKREYVERIKAKANKTPAKVH